MILKATRVSGVYTVLRYDGTNLAELNDFMGSHFERWQESLESPSYAIMSPTKQFLGLYSEEYFNETFIFIENNQNNQNNK